MKRSISHNRCGIATGAFAVALSMAVPAQANVSYTQARVLDVEPIYQRVSEVVPREVCQIEEIPYREPVRRSATAPILGAVVGGALGHAVGHKKRNKQVGVAVGALLGGSIGADIGRRRAADADAIYYRSERVCHTRNEVHEEERAAGYRVTYIYGSDTFTTTMAQAPGATIDVRVSVAPVER